MISTLSVRDFALTTALEIEYDSHLNVITGETGAGKSITLDAITMLIGARANPALIRHGQPQADIQGRFELANEHQAYQWLEANGLDADGDCIVRRVLRRDKPSRGYINGVAVTASQLQTLGNLLLDIHGQHDHHKLLKGDYQRQILDQFAGVAAELSQLTSCHEQLQSTQKQLQELHDAAQDYQQRRRLIEIQLAEFTELAAREGEWEEIDKQQKRLSNQATVMQAHEQLIDLLGNYSDGVIERLNRSLSEIKALQDIDSSYQDISKMLNEALINSQESHDQLQQLNKHSIDPQQAAFIEQRCRDYMSMARKYFIDPNELENKAIKLQEELDQLSDPVALDNSLREKLSELQSEYHTIADKISKKRLTAAKLLSSAVSETIQELAMPSGHFVVELPSTAEDSYAKYGKENVVFLVSANKGNPPQALNKVASGGELSRISLAIQVITAQGGEAAALILDEVDVGIGGAVGNIVGQRLRELSAHRQIICVTHLAQVAACAQHHLHVRKQETNENISVSVTALDAQQRVIELARMAGDDKASPEALAYASQLLNSAQSNPLVN